MTEPIVEFVPPAVTIDSVSVDVKDDNVIEITTRVTVWTDNILDIPRFDYSIGDTYLFRDGMEISSEPKQHIFVDVLTLKLHDLFIHDVHIDVATEHKRVYLPDYIQISDEELNYPNVGVWVML